MSILITVVIVFVSMILLAIRIIFKKNGRFSSQHISQNKRMQENGIHCATSQDREVKFKARKKMNLKEL